jgi:glycosyltransferase involved in cell wall biosynthesis
MLLSSIAMGGAERNVVSVLPYLQREGIKVSLCTLNKRRDSPLADAFVETGIERIDLEARRLVDFKSWKRFVALLRTRKVDLVHAEDQDSIIYAGMIRRIHGIPALMTRHVLEEPSSTWKAALRARIVLLAARYGMDDVIAVSEVVRQLFSEQAGVSLSKICTIHNGIELEKFSNRIPKAEIRKRLGWSTNVPIALLVSVLRPGKGLEIAIKAVPEILGGFPDFQLKIVGSGELESELKKMASHLGASIEFLGERMDVPELMWASDLLIQSSWSEALPTVLIEAGAAALPVVATDVGGTAEIVRDEGSGYLIKAGDVKSLSQRVLEIVANPSLRAQMGQEALEIVTQKFSLKTQARATAALYERILSKSK